jgi:hypothetical protein
MTIRIRDWNRLLGMILFAGPSLMSAEKLSALETSRNLVTVIKSEESK